MFQLIGFSQFLHYWPQFICVITGTLSMVSVGMNSGWPSPSLRILQSGHYYFNTNENQAYLISKTLQIGAFFGAPLAASVIDIIGRKKTILIVTIPYCVSWILIAYGRNMAMFLVARFLAGISEGSIYIAVPMYIGEISDVKIRGVLGTISSIGSCFGSLLINVVGPYSTIRTTAFVGLLIPLISLITFCFMPESPYFFLMKKKEIKAKKSLRFLRNTKNVDIELKNMTKDIDRMLSERGNFKDLFKIASNRKALFIMMGLRIAQQLSGINVFSNHIKIIFEMTGVKSISNEISAILYIGIQITITLIFMIVIDKFPRKYLLVTSFLATSLVLFSQSIFFYLRDYSKIKLDDLDFIPVALLFIYIIVNCGLSILPSVVLSELFSSSIKPKALCLMHMYYSVVFLIAMKIFECLKDFLFLPFLIYSVCCLLSALFVYTCLPETKGRSLEEIQQIIKNNQIGQK